MTEMTEEMMTDTETETETDTRAPHEIRSEMNRNRRLANAAKAAALYAKATRLYETGDTWSAENEFSAATEAEKASK